MGIIDDFGPHFQWSPDLHGHICCVCGLVTSKPRVCTLLYSENRFSLASTIMILTTIITTFYHRESWAWIAARSSHMIGEYENSSASSRGVPVGQRSSVRICKSEGCGPLRLQRALPLEVVLPAANRGGWGDPGGGCGVERRGTRAREIDA